MRKDCKKTKNNLEKRYKGVKNWLKQKLEISQDYEIHIILNIKRAVFKQYTFGTR